MDAKQSSLRTAHTSTDIRILKELYSSYRFFFSSWSYVYWSPVVDTPLQTLSFLWFLSKFLGVLELPICILFLELQHTGYQDIHTQFCHLVASPACQQLYLMWCLPRERCLWPGSEGFCFCKIKASLQFASLRNKRQTDHHTRGPQQKIKHQNNKIKLNIQNSRKSYLQTIFTKIMFKKFQWKCTDGLDLLGYGKLEFRSPVNLGCRIRNPGL